MRTGLFIGSLLCLGCSLTAHAIECDVQVAVEDIRRWIADWDNPSFTARNAASIQVREAGITAFPILVDATRDGTPETITRALVLLKTSLSTGDDSVRVAARKALYQIAAVPNSTAGRTARQILVDSDRPPGQLAGGNFGGWQNGPPMGVPNGFGNIAQRINTWTRGGSTTIEAFERDRKIKIQSSATGRVTVEITQKRQGGDVTNRFDAESLAELKRKHPAAHQDYRRYESTLKEARMIAQRNPPAARPAPQVPMGIRPGGELRGALQILRNAN